MPEQMRPRGKAGIFYADFWLDGIHYQDSLGTSDRRWAERNLANLKNRIEGGDYYKHKTVFQDLIPNYLEQLSKRSAYGEGYRLPRVKYNKLNKEILDPLTLNQIETVSKYINDGYKPIYWIMAYTGMDVSDVIFLKPKDFKEGWIKKERGKSGIDIAVPVCDPLADILKSVPWPINQGARIFPNHTPKGTATYVRRCFKKAGLDGYGSKYLRRFIASILLDNGYSNDWIGKALAHADGSKITKKYSKVYESTLQEAFGKIKKKEIEKQSMSYEVKNGGKSGVKVKSKTWQLF